jgi:predicted kinase
MAKGTPALVLTRGLPGSGKSTWTCQQVSGSGGQVKRVNRDDLRTTLDCGIWSKANEQIVVKVQRQIVRTLLNEGYTVIVDDTNLNPSIVDFWRQMCKDYPCDFAIKDFDVSIDECIARDARRDASVGADVIRDMAAKWHVGV